MTLTVQLVMPRCETAAGMHEGVVPTYPASHGCIRLPSEAARKLFVEIPVGTVVMIN